MRSLFLLVMAVTVSVPVAGQATIPDRINAAGKLIQQGRCDEAIVSLKSMEQSASLGDVELGRVETLLGLAYKHLGWMQKAEQSFEKALGDLAQQSRTSADFARALNCMGSLELAKGDAKTGERLLRQAARIEEQLQDRSGLATVDLHLVGSAIAQKHWKDARKYLDAANALAAQAESNRRELKIDVEEATGWLATVTGHPAEAVSAYKDALGDCRDAYGVQHPLTGWSYLLLGKSIAANRDLPRAMENMRTGLGILKAATGEKNSVYLRGELAYARVLDQAGQHAEADRLREEATRSLATLSHAECANCTVSVWALEDR